MLESKLQKKIIQFLEAKGFYVVKIISANKKGVPDLLCSFSGIFVGLEIKAGSKVSAIQNYHLEQIEKAKGLAFVVRSVDEVEYLCKILFELKVKNRIDVKGAMVRKFGLGCVFEKLESGADMF
jgi:hypothetical protein